MKNAEEQKCVVCKKKVQIIKLLGENESTKRAETDAMLLYWPIQSLEPDYHGKPVHLDCFKASFMPPSGSTDSAESVSFGFVIF